MAIIRVSDLNKSYHNGNILQPVLNQLNLTIEQGEFVFLVGPSGSGKTTLLYVLSGLEPFNSGVVELFDKDITSYTEKEHAFLRSHEIGFVFQFYNLIPNLTVYENIYLASVLSEQKSKEDIKHVLSLVGMESFMNYYPSQLSGGMQQRVAIARCLINNPKIIFADEPTGNLDQKTSADIMALFKKLHQKHHLTILMVTHHEDATKYGTRVLHMFDGKVIEDEKNHK